MASHIVGVGYMGASAVVGRRKCNNCTGTGPTSLHFTEQSISFLSITELKTLSAQWLHLVIKLIYYWL